MHLNLTLIFGGLSAAFWILSAICIGIWTYHDARRRGLANPRGWIALTSLVPFCIGLIIYSVVKPAPITVQCTYCRTPIHKKQPQCPGCGARGVEARPAVAAPSPKARQWITGYVVGCVGCAVFYLVAVIVFWLPVISVFS